MKVRYLILARYAEFTSDGMVNIIGGDNDKIVAEEYPHIHPLLAVVARIVLDRTDTIIEHNFRSLIADSDTKEIIAEGPLGSIPTLVMPVEAKYLGTGILLQFQNIIFPKAGSYEVNLLIDEVVLAEARFRVAPIAYYQDLQKSVQVMQGKDANA